MDEMSETITDFSDFLKPAKEKEAFDVEECVDDAISLMEESINLHKIKTDIVRETDRKALRILQRGLPMSYSTCLITPEMP